MSYDGPVWEGVYRSFQEVPAAGDGHDGDVWIGRSRGKMEALLERTGGKAILPPASNYRECLLPLVTALVYEEKRAVRILDFGGGMGFSYQQTVDALSGDRGVEYHIVEREGVCRAGRDLFRTRPRQPLFISDLDQVRGGYDIVHLGSVIQYVEDWASLLGRLGRLSDRYLLLVDVLAGDVPTFATAQCYYGQRIPAWFLNIGELLAALTEQGYELIFKSVYRATILGVEQKLPMQNFEEKHRLPDACNLLLRKKIQDRGRSKRRDDRSDR
jgi:putative methyltransferase (TIGR04325 family)